jgi:circadian clock protein KaiB
MTETKTNSTKEYVFLLFVSANSILSIRAIKNCREILEEKLKDMYSLEVIDIYEHPDRVIQEQIITTPILIKKHPLPEIKITGDLSETAKVIKELLI